MYKTFYTGGLMKIGNSLMAYHRQNRFYEIFNHEGLLIKKAHIQSVINVSRNIAEFQHSNVDMEFLALCAEHHDDGRVNQYELLGKFWDNKVSHNTLGIERLNAFLLTQNNPEIDKSLEILRDVMLYHGRMWLTNLSKESLPYVEIVTAADDFENACSCVTYLLDEVKNDAKGYIAANPTTDQTQVSSYVFDHFKRGEKFDKSKYCTTYGEYIIFAATLATNCIRKYSDIAKVALAQTYNGMTVVENFHEIFKATLTPEMAEEAFEVLSSF